ncbi:hypothetical protein AMS64_06670 [Aeromonas veronii]|nr:hypothetical protein AMS64_06670 [Aeromonas veronii]
MTSKISPKTIFSSVALVIALGSLEKSIVTTPLPMIGAELHAGAALTWVVTAYLLAATAVLPLYGKLSDLFGRVRMLNIGIGLFLAGSVACALSQDLPTLLAARVLQGLGGAVDGSDGAPFRLHLDNPGGIPPQVLAPFARPGRRLLSHGRAGGDGVDGDDFAGAVRHRGDCVIPVCGDHVFSTLLCQFEGR